MRYPELPLGPVRAVMTRSYPEGSHFYFPEAKPLRNEQVQTFQEAKDSPSPLTHCPAPQSSTTLPCSSELPVCPSAEQQKVAAGAMMAILQHPANSA